MTEDLPKKWPTVPKEPEVRKPDAPPVAAKPDVLHAPPFVQIAVWGTDESSDQLYALDCFGRVWTYYFHTEGIGSGWRRLSNHVLKFPGD